MPKDPIQSDPAIMAAPGLSYAEFTDFGRETITAAMNSTATLGAGLEAIGQEFAQYAKAAFESTGETARSLLGARTFEDVVRLQTDYAKRSFEGLVERGAKLSELGCSLFGASFSVWGQRAKS
jgi:hypothetical protein